MRLGQAPAFDDEPLVFEARFPGCFDGIVAQLAEIEGLLVTQTLSDDLRHKMVIVLGEVLNNIVEHAYRDWPGDKTITVRLFFDCNAVQVETHDRGRAMPDYALPPGVAPSVDVDRADLPEGGFGWYLIHTLASDLAYRRERDCNILSFTLWSELA